ncbi:MAG: N-acetylmuramoyl-L-alanine amidase [Clostridia bacterium]|nr:N-acetylmuramoyl-L-alanine amidase [Clostridia bacterium]
MIVLKRRSIVIVTVLLATFLTFVLCVSALKEKPISNTSVNKARIVLDAGHGGIDAGVTGVLTNVKESELNLKVVKKLEKYLLGAGMNVVLTRSTDAGLYGVANKNLKRKDMEKRRDIIREAEPHLVVSIHMNKFSMSERRGAQVFYKSGDENAKILANSVQDCFNSMEEAVRECSALTGDYYILNCSDYPSIIAECGFLSNPEDEKLLITDEYQDSIAYTIFKGIVGYFAQTSFKVTD